MCDTCDLLKSTLISIAHQHREGDEVPLPPSELIDHLSLAHAACEDYKADQKKARKKEISHFSFDYSQNLTLPQKADQPGSFYFFSLRNICLFGITDESCNHQMNYLMDESQCAKGSNEVISMISHFLSSLPKEKRAHIVFKYLCKSFVTFLWGLILNFQTVTSSKLLIRYLTLIIASDRTRTTP